MTARRIALALVGLIALAAVAAVVALKTPLLRRDLTPDPLGDSAEGRATVARMQAAHGGLDRWLARSWVEFELTGELPALPVRFGFDLGERAALTLRFDPCDRAPMTMRVDDGEHTYDGPVADAPSGNRFLAHSIRHLFEMPFAMRSADVVHAAPPADSHARVFMSWGTAAPQMDVDQYIVELGPDGRMTGFESTVRGVAPFLMADVEYTDRVERDGLALAAHASVGDGAGEVVHAWRLDAMTLGPPRSTDDRCGP